MASGVPSESGDGQGKFIPMAYGFGKWKGKGSIRKAMNLLKKPHVEQGKGSITIKLTPLHSQFYRMK